MPDNELIEAAPTEEPVVDPAIDTTSPETEGAPVEAGSLWDDMPGDAQPAPDAPPEQADENAPYEADYADVIFVDDAQRELITSYGQKHGIDAKAFGALVADFDAMLREQNEQFEARNREATTATLKQSWGAEFDAKSREARTGFNLFAQSVGLTAEELKAQLPATPATMQLLQQYAAQRSGAASGVAGSPSAGVTLDKDGIPAFISDPAHPDYEDYYNPQSTKYAGLRKLANKYCQAGIR